MPRATDVQVMIDIETAGTTPGSAILQIGAVPFADYCFEFPVPLFNQGIALNSCLGAGLTVDKSTTNWWDKQDSALKERIFGSTNRLADTLEAFYLWCKSLPGIPVVWGNGANFDITLLEAAFKAVNVPVPWHYRNVMCYRTLTSRFPLPKARKDNIPANTRKHDALADAVYQSRVLIETNIYVEEISNGLLRIL